MNFPDLWRAYAPTLPEPQAEYRFAPPRRWRCWWCQQDHTEEELPDPPATATTEDSATAAYYNAVAQASEAAALRRLSGNLPALFEDAP